MSRLAAYVEKLKKVLETAKSGSAAEPQAQLELLHQILHQIRTGSEAETKEVQPKLEEVLTSALLLGPSPSLSNLISHCFVTLYSAGSRTTLYTMVESLESWLSNRQSPANTVAAKVAVELLLGELCGTHGPAMVSLTLDAITLLTKLSASREAALGRSSVPGERAGALLAAEPAEHGRRCRLD